MLEETWAHSGRIRDMFAGIRPTSSKLKPDLFGRTPPDLVRFWPKLGLHRIRPMHGRCRANSAKFGPASIGLGRADSGQVEAISSRFDQHGPISTPCGRRRERCLRTLVEQRLLENWTGHGLLMDRRTSGAPESRERRESGAPSGGLSIGQCSRRARIWIMQGFALFRFWRSS